jgi:hypothetical protein
MTSVRRTGPVLNRPSAVICTIELRGRLLASMRRHGSQHRASLALGIGSETMVAALARGRMMQATVDRIVAALDADEAFDTLGCEPPCAGVE